MLLLVHQPCHNIESVQARFHNSFQVVECYTLYYSICVLLCISSSSHSSCWTLARRTVIGPRYVHLISFIYLKCCIHVHSRLSLIQTTSFIPMVFRNSFNFDFIRRNATYSYIQPPQRVRPTNRPPLSSAHSSPSTQRPIQPLLPPTQQYKRLHLTAAVRSSTHPCLVPWVVLTRVY